MVKLFLYTYLAVQNVVRNRKKTLTSGLGIMLAIMIIFSNSLAVTLQARAILAKALEDKEYHIRYRYSLDTYYPMNASEYDQFNKELDDVENIEQYNTLWSYDQGYYGSNRTGFTLGEPDESTFKGPHNVRISRSNSITEYTTVATGTVSIYNSTAEANGYSVGDIINVTSILYSSKYDKNNRNITIHKEHVSVSLTLGEIINSSYDYGYYSYYNTNITLDNNTWNSSYPYFSYVFLNPSDLLTLLDGINNRDRIEFSYYGWLKDDVYTDNGLNRSKSLAVKASTEVYYILASEEHGYRFNIQEDRKYHDVYLNQEFREAYNEVGERQYETGLFALALSVPLILIGIYIAYLGVELFIRGRRRELGLLKVRGATSRNINYILNVEAVLIGSIAGLIGLLLAVFAVKVFMRYTQAASYLAKIPWYETGLTIPTVVFAMALGAIFLFLSYLHPLYRISKLETSEMLANYSRLEDRSPYKRKYDIALLITALFFLGLLPFLQDLENTTHGVNNFFMEMVSSLLRQLTPLMVVVSPYIFIFTLVRLATRGSTRPYTWVAEKTRRVSGSLNYIVRKNIINGERRITKVTTVLSITIAFLVLTSTFYYSTKAKEEALIRSELGGDLSFRLYTPMDFSNTSLFLHRLDNISGINSASVIQVQEGLLVEDQVIHIEHSSGWDEKIQRDVKLNLVDGINYTKLAYLDQRIWQDGDADSIADLDGSPGKGVITIGLARYLDLEVGDTFEILREYSRLEQVLNDDNTTDTIRINEELLLGTIEVTGIIKSLPGSFDNDIEYDKDNAHYYYEMMLFMDRNGYRTLMDGFYQQHPEYTRESTSYPIVLLGIADDMDHEKIMADLEEHLESNGYGYYELRSVETKITAINSEPTSDSLLLLLRTQLAVLVFLSMLVAMIIVYMASLEREGEMANIQLKGTTRKQVFQLQVGETITILIYSILVGILTGILAALAWIFTFNMFEGSQIIGYSYFPSPYQLPALGVMAALVLLVSYGVTKMYIKTDLAKVIKLRSG